MHRSRSRSGEISPLTLLSLGSTAVVLLASILMLGLRRESASAAGSNDGIRVYCAAGVAKPIEIILEQYRGATGQSAQLTRAGGSGKLYGQIDMEVRTGVDRGADLFICADDALMQRGREAGLIAEIIPLAVQRPVIAVRADSALSPASLGEMIQETRFGIANENAAVGGVARRLAEQADVLAMLLESKATEVENVMQLAQALQTGNLEAGIIWDTTVAQVNRNADADVLKIAATLESPDEFTGGRISIGVLTNTASPTAALQAARFIAAADRGMETLEEYGFEIATGDEWSERPVIHLFCGSMFSPVFEHTVREFASREGVDVYPRWEGCGKLVAAMESIQDTELFPSAFLACDQEFVERVHDRFTNPTAVSRNEIVIVISKALGNSFHDLAQLSNESLRVGICHPEESALGYLTKRYLSSPEYGAVYGAIAENAAVITDTGPTLVSQMLAGGLDAAIVYRSNVMADPHNLDALVIRQLGPVKAEARQAWAVAKGTPYPRLVQRLFEALTTAESAARFEEAGFAWMGKMPARGSSDQKTW